MQMNSSSEKNAEKKSSLYLTYVHNRINIIGNTLLIGIMARSLRKTNCNFMLSRWACYTKFTPNKNISNYQ